MHRIILQSRSPVFNAMLNGPMREGAEGEVTVQDVEPHVFRVLLHFVYSDALPQEHEGGALQVPMAQVRAVSYLDFFFLEEYSTTNAVLVTCSILQRRWMHAQCSSFAEVVCCMKAFFQLCDTVSEISVVVFRTVDES